MRLFTKFIKLKRIIAVSVPMLLLVLSVLMVGALRESVKAGPVVDERALHFNAQNDAVFYSNGCVSSGGTSSLCGNTAMEMYWSAVSKYIDDPIKVAGVMGNLAHEGNFQPLLWEYDYTNSDGTIDASWDTLYNCGSGTCPFGVGAFGFTYNLGAYFHAMSEEAPELINYYRDSVQYSVGAKHNHGVYAGGDTYPTWGDVLMAQIGKDEFAKIVDYEVGYAMGPWSPSSTESYLEQNFATPSDAARWWMEYWERPADGGSVGYRMRDAEKVYDEFKNFVCSGGGGSSSSSGSSSGTVPEVSSENITLVGDSISVFSESELQSKFPTSFMTKVGSRHPASGGLCAGDEGGLAVLQKIVSGSGTVMNQSGNNCVALQVDSSSLKDNVVWELGANVNGATRATMDQVVDLVVNEKQKKLFLVTPYNGVMMDYTDDIANMYRQVAAENENVFIVDWNNAVRNNESTYIVRSDSMAVHPTAEGSKLLADLIAEAVGGAGDGCGTSAGANPIVTVDGHEYMFPLASASKESYLDNGTFSPMPCTNYAVGACHHEYVALDLGLDKSMVDGNPVTDADYPDLDYPDWWYDSTGVKALAFVDGKIDSYRCYTNYVPYGYDDQCKCASIGFEGADGYRYWIGHLSFDSDIKAKADAGEEFKLGDVIGEVGPPPCAQGTPGHIHVDVQRGTETHIYDVINAAYNALPETQSEVAGGGGSSSGSNCPATCSNSNSGGLDSLTDEQAQRLADYYNSPEVDPSTLVLGMKDNCVSFSVWFAEFFAGMDGHLIGGNGKDVAHSINEVYGATEGREPVPFSVFSVTQGTLVCRDGYICGHTGVVVAVDGDTVTTVEAAYGYYAGTVAKYNKSFFVNTRWGNSFVYLDTLIDKSKLANIVGRP